MNYRENIICKNILILYCCRVYNTVFFTASRYKIQPFSFPPRIREGESTKLWCSVNTEEKIFTFNWYKDGKSIKSDDRTEISQHVDYSLLKIKSVLSRDAGNYTCVVSSPQVTLNYSAILLVEGKYINFIVLFAALDINLKISKINF